MPFAALLRITIVIVAACAGYLPAQSTLTRFFVLPDDTSAAPGSISRFTGTEAGTPYAFDFTEDLRYNRGGFMTLSQDLGNPFIWNVVDFHISAHDPTLGPQGSQVVFSRPQTPGPYGTFTSSDPNGFPDGSTVSVSITGDINVTGPLGGVWPQSTTLTMGGTVQPGYYHNFLELNGSFIGIGGTVKLFTKNDFYPPAVTWEMVLKGASSSAQPAGEIAPLPALGGFTMQRGITNPNIYSIWNLHIEVPLPPTGTPPVTPSPVVITTLPAQTAGLLTFDPGSRGLTGSLNLLVDGVPATMTVDGIGEAFTGCVMHPTSIVFDEPTGLGPLSLVHFECASTEVVPTNPPTNDFQIGVSTQLVFRGRAGDYSACGATFNPLPGVNTTVGDIPVTVDDLLLISLDPNTPYFSDMIAVMPLSGERLISVNLPYEPLLIGVTFFFGGATFDPNTFAVHAATNSHRATVK